MSFSGFKPPKELDFQGNVAQAWKKFISEFDIFLCATGLDEKPEKRQVMCLLNVIGARGRAVYNAMQFTADGDNLKFAIVKKKFEATERARLSGQCSPSVEKVYFRV